ncbi:putative response regulator receiver RIM15p [Pseudovirgaria hyperparasitica]|uniref:non-specific serine/threonine protein kinase n=1 Tax=Pseudovirgaria hyperparasitica TaxID=470096 RepID=A0A6A6VWQ8_9PEZI|nr:putative response regulator receiver RIM15p [Pseudovirgaria hyperparasitica]KAF2754289.1 putative response regulator receiver RIM15p [Pseudovirgaria hyperparasitica]
MSEEVPKPMAPPAVTALREAAAGERHLGPRIPMERSVSQDIREERQDLKEAAEHSLNVLMDLDLDGNVRWVSLSWEEVIGTSPDTVKGKPISDILVGNKTAFADAVDSMKKDDSRSHIIRFTMQMGPSSVLRPDPKSPTSPTSVDPATSEHEETEYLNLEAQGIMVYDSTTGNESHTMWMIRPSVVREVTIDLPEILVESLGIGAEMLAHYLTGLAEAGPTNSGEHAPPLPVLCRICERQITPWWFEKHTELCLQEHKAEMDVQMAQENLSEHRNAIVRVLDALETSHQQVTAASTESSGTLSTVPEYKGLPIQPSSTPSSGTVSGRASPASPPSRSQDRSTGFGHHRARSFAVRRPIARIVELVLDLCDTAIEINTPAIKDNRGTSNELRTQSPQSENRISQVLQWQSPNTGSLEQGLALLCEDTSKLARAKVDSVYRHRRILEYSERIRCEFDVLVHECIEAAMHKAAKIAAGEDSESSEESASQVDEDEDEDEPSGSLLAAPEENVPDGGIFPGSFDAPSSMAQALRKASDALAANPERRAPSTTASTRSSSPHGSQTPRSHAGTTGFVSQTKRASMQFESDAGADSDASVRSSAKSAARRGDSPGSELNLSRVASSRERKRKSLVLPSVMSSRQQSPARSMGPPSSPLRTKPRIPSGAEPFHSPITSPVLSNSDFSSPAIAPQHNHHHHQQHHRRQSSAAGSDILRPLSPRMVPTSNPQPRAVAPSIRDFEIIKPISKGAFGSVYLAKKKSTGDYFAIKVLKKNDMVAKNQVTNVKAERAIMMWQGESDFVAKLYWTFSSKDFLYLVMEYLNGGDCASLIKVLGALPEDWAKKYLAEVVMGVEHLHSRNIVHRDLKPDNLLIDQKGHLKLTDFGLSRMGLIGRQKNALNRKSDEAAVPDLLKQGPFQRAKSIGSSRSASFDFQGNNASPSATPSLTPALTGDIGQPSYFNLNRDSSHNREARRTSGNRSDSGDTDVLQAMFRRFSLVEEQQANRKSPIEEENPSEDSGSPDPYTLHPILSQSSAAQNMTPPQVSTMLPPPTTLFDPEDKNRRFVGTPDYLAPETIEGDGQGEVSDWWSLGCILFESLYGYPPFHADTPEEVFQNILDRKIDWPDEENDMVSDEAKDLMNRLMCVDPNKRLGANAEERYSCGGEEIRNHPWFSDINWETLREDEASFVPAPENPEDTEYFDARGATLSSFAPEFEDQQSSSNTNTPGADYPDRPHDALSRIRSQVNVNTMKRGLIPLHIPPHVREGRGRRLSEPMAQDDFGSFNYKNLPVLEKANKDVIQKLRAEAKQSQSKPPSTLTSPGVSSPTPSLESSPMLPMPLKRTMSTSKSGQNANRPASPSVSQANSSPSRTSQPSSPLLVQFSTGQNHERRKTSSGSSSLSHQQPSLQPGSFFDQSRLPPGLKTSSSVSSPVKIAKTPGAMPGLHTEKTFPGQRHSSGSGSSLTSPRARSQTVGSQESEASKDSLPSHHKRRSQVMDVSPSSSDNEDQRAKALLRVQRRRQSSRRLSQINITDGPFFRPLDVLVCEDHPVSRLVMEKLLEKLRCRTITVQDGSEAVRYAMSEVKFDIIMMEFKLPQINGADVARMIRDTKNANCHTPIVAVTGYLKDLQAPHHFDALIEKPPTIANLTEVLGRLCQWKPPPPNWTPTAYSALAPSSLRMESSRLGDSPTSNTSSFPQMPSGSYRGSSREDSISSSFFGDGESMNDLPIVISRSATEDWRDRDLSTALGGLGITEEAIVTSDMKLPPRTEERSLALDHQNSAPAVLQHPTPKEHRSGEQSTKIRVQENRRNEAADMGDDEDEELGDAQVRAKSPRTRPKASSKLGTEMMRTNSHGSVISVEEIKDTVDVPSSIPPCITEEINPLETSKTPKQQVSMTPPEIFPPRPGDNVQIIDMDATPKAVQTDLLEISPMPTPKASALNASVERSDKSSGSPSERK